MCTFIISFLNGLLAFESASRDIGKAMRFVSRHLFKRMLPGPHARRIATFFSGGPSVDPQTITTASLEFSALDIIPVVIAFNQVPAVRRSFVVRRPPAS